jgi:hypothetical protein
MAEAGEYGRAPQYGAKTGPAATALAVRGGAVVPTQAAAPVLPLSSYELDAEANA